MCSQMSSMMPVSEWAGGCSERENPVSKSIIQKITFLQTVALLSYRLECQCHATLSTFFKLVTPRVSSPGTDQIGNLERNLISVFDDFYVSMHS